MTGALTKRQKLIGKDKLHPPYNLLPKSLADEEMR